MLVMFFVDLWNQIALIGVGFTLIQVGLNCFRRTAAWLAVLLSLACLLAGLLPAALPSRIQQVCENDAGQNLQTKKLAKFRSPRWTSRTHTCSRSSTQQFFGVVLNIGIYWGHLGIWDCASNERIAKEKKNGCQYRGLVCAGASAKSELNPTKLSRVGWQSQAHYEAPTRTA